MSEEEKSNVEQVTDQPAQEVVQPTESDETHNDRQEEAQPSQQPRRTDVDYNWNEARRKMQELERRAQEQDALIARLSRPAPVEDDLEKLSDDDIITVKQHKQMAAKIAKQVAEEVVKQREAATMEERLANKFPDYDQVVTADSIELLKKTEPELALSLQSLAHDPYAQAVAAYKLMKKTGIGQPKQQTDEKKRAMENIKKPVSVQTVSKQSAIGSAHAFENGLTPEIKKQLYAEMQQAARNG